MRVLIDIKSNEIVVKRLRETYAQAICKRGSGSSCSEKQCCHFEDAESGFRTIVQDIIFDWERAHKVA